MRLRIDWVRTVPPELPVLTPVEAKLQARVRHAREDTLWDAWIAAATGAAESYLGAGLLTQTWQASLSGWFDALPLPMAAPLQSVTSVKYYATDGTLTTLAASAYTYSTGVTPGQIARAPLAAWPALQSGRDWPVIVTYVVGRTSADDVPELVKQGIRILAAAMDQDRDGLVEADLQAARSAAETYWALEGRVWPAPPVEAC